MECHSLAAPEPVGPTAPRRRTAQIVNAYAAANGGAFPAANLDSVTINGTTWGYNGIDTVEEKTQYAIQNGYGGVMIWELGQDYFTGGGVWRTFIAAGNQKRRRRGIRNVDWKRFELLEQSRQLEFWPGPGEFHGCCHQRRHAYHQLAVQRQLACFERRNADARRRKRRFPPRLLTVNPGATLDLSNNKLLINYGANADPISTIAASIASGYAAGAWNGQGIVSSAIARSTPPRFQLRHRLRRLRRPGQSGQLAQRQHRKSCTPCWVTSTLTGRSTAKISRHSRNISARAA